MRVIDIIKAASLVFNISEKSIVSTARSEYHVNPRWAVMYIAHHIYGHSLTAIGRVMNKDHSTVHHALKRSHIKMKDDHAFSIKVMKMKLMLETLEESI